MGSGPSKTKVVQKVAAGNAFTEHLQPSREAMAKPALPSNHPRSIFAEHLTRNTHGHSEENSSSEYYTESEEEDAEADERSSSRASSRPASSVSAAPMGADAGWEAEAAEEEVSKAESVSEAAKLAAARPRPPILSEDEALSHKVLHGAERFSDFKSGRELLHMRSEETVRSLEGALEKWESQLLEKVAEITKLKDECQVELVDYEETVARGLPSKAEQKAARVIQRCVRGKLGRGIHAVAMAAQQMLERQSATRLQAAFRARAERQRVAPLQTISRREREMLQAMAMRLHSRLLNEARKIFDRQAELMVLRDLRASQQESHADFGCAYGALGVIGEFDLLVHNVGASDYKPTVTSDASALAIDKARVQQGIDEAIASACQYRTWASRCRAFRQRVAVIHELRDWLTHLPTPVEEDEAQMAARHEDELTELRTHFDKVYTQNVAAERRATNARIEELERELAHELETDEAIKRDSVMAAGAKFHTAELQTHERAVLTGKILKMRVDNDDLHDIEAAALRDRHVAQVQRRVQDLLRPAADFSSTKMKERLEMELREANVAVEAYEELRTVRAGAAKLWRAKRGVLEYLQSQNNHYHAEPTAAAASMRAEIAQLKEELDAAKARVQALTPNPRIRLATLRAKLMITDALGGKSMSGGVVAGHLVLLEEEEAKMQPKLRELEPHLIQYKAAVDRLGRWLGTMRHLKTIQVFGASKLQRAGVEIVEGLTDHMGDGDEDLDRDEDEQRSRRYRFQAQKKLEAETAAAAMLKAMAKRPFVGIQLGKLQNWRWFCADKPAPDGHGCRLRVWLRRVPQRERKAYTLDANAEPVDNRTVKETPATIVQIRAEISAFYAHLDEWLKFVLPSDIEAKDAKPRTKDNKPAPAAARELTTHTIWQVLETKYVSAILGGRTGRKASDSQKLQATKQMLKFLRQVHWFSTDEHQCPMCQLLLRFMGLYRPVRPLHGAMEVYMKGRALYVPYEEESHAEDDDREAGLSFLSIDAAQEFIAETGRVGPTLFGWQEHVQYDDLFSELFKWEGDISEGDDEPEKASSLEVILKNSNDQKRKEIEDEIKASADSAAGVKPAQDEVRPGTAEEHARKDASDHIKAKFTKLRISELMAYAAVQSGAKYTMREARREANIAAGACSVIQQYATDGVKWSFEDCRHAVQMTTVIEEIKIKSHYRRYPNGVRAELAQLQQINMVSKAQLCSAEESVEQLSNASEEAQQWAADEVGKAEEQFNSSGFKIMALKRERSKLHHSRGRLVGLAELTHLMNHCLAMKPKKNDLSQPTVEPHQRERVAVDGTLEFEEEFDGRVRWRTGYAVVWRSDHHISWRPRIDIYVDQKSVQTGEPVKSIKLRHTVVELSRPEKRYQTITVSTKRKDAKIRLLPKNARAWLEVIKGAVKKPPGNSKLAKMPEWQQRQEKKWREGVTMLCVRFSMARHSAEEIAAVALQNVIVSDKAVKDACTLHGRLAALLRLHNNAKPVPRLLISARRSMLKIQLALTLADSHGSLPAYARYKAEKARLRSLTTVLHLVQRMGNMAIDHRQAGRQYKTEVQKMSKQAKIASQMASAALADSDTHAAYSNYMEARRSWYRKQGALALVFAEHSLSEEDDANNHVDLETDIEEATTEVSMAELKLNFAQKQKTAVKQLRRSLLTARAKLLVFSLYEGRLPTAQEVFAHAAAVEEEQALLTQSTAVLGELASSHQAAVANTEAIIGSMQMLKSIVNKPKMEVAIALDRQAYTLRDEHPSLPAAALTLMELKASLASASLDYARGESARFGCEKAEQRLWIHEGGLAELVQFRNTLYSTETEWGVLRHMQKSVEARADLDPPACGLLQRAQAAEMEKLHLNHVHHGALELVAAAVDTPNAVRWHKLYDLLEENYAVRAADAEEPLNTATDKRVAALRATEPLFREEGAKSVAMELQAELLKWRALPRPPSISLAFVQEPPPEFARAEVNAAARMANNYRARKARQALAMKKADKKAAAEQERQRMEAQRRYEEAVFTVQALYRGLLARRRYNMEKALHDAAEALAAGAAAVKKEKAEPAMQAYVEAVVKFDSALRHPQKVHPVGLVALVTDGEYGDEIEISELPPMLTEASTATDAAGGAAAQEFASAVRLARRLLHEILDSTVAIGIHPLDKGAKRREEAARKREAAALKAAAEEKKRKERKRPKALAGGIQIKIARASDQGGTARNKKAVHTLVRHKPGTMDDRMRAAFAGTATYDVIAARQQWLRAPVIDCWTANPLDAVDLSSVERQVIACAIDGARRAVLMHAIDAVKKSKKLFVKKNKEWAKDKKLTKEVENFDLLVAGLVRLRGKTVEDVRLELETQRKAAEKEAKKWTKAVKAAKKKKK